MLNIYINTWGNYNENGADGGKWITLPMDAEELTEELETVAAAMQDTDPEWFVNDYEWTGDLELFEVCEMDSIAELNERIQELDNLEEYECEALAAIMDTITSDYEEAFAIVQRGSYVFYRGMDLSDVAEELVNECYFTKDTPDFLMRYFDYEAFARDLSFDGYHETEWGVIYTD